MELGRIAYALLGWCLTGVGIVGMVTPGLPGFVFLLLALACFRNSSPKAEEWLLNHKWFGEKLRDYDTNRWITMKLKVFISVLISVMTYGSARQADLPWVKGVLIALGVIGVGYVMSRRTKPANLVPATSFSAKSSS